MDLNSLRLFVAVVQAGSLSMAAARSNMPLPTVSRRIRDLETELKLRLFERSTRGVRLTDVGARLYEHAITGIESLADAELVIRQDEATLKGRLRLSIPPTFEPWWALTADFQRKHSLIKIEIFTTERRVDLIEDGIDVALRVGDLVHDTIVGRRLFKYRHLLVASPSLLDKHGAPDKPGALARFPCAVWRRSAGLRTVWNLGDESFEPEAVLATNDYAHLRDRAIAGLAVTELPPFLAYDSIAKGALKIVLPKHPLPEQDISLLHPSRRWVSSIVRAYIDFCQAYGPDYCAGRRPVSTRRRDGKSRR